MGTILAVAVATVWVQVTPPTDKWYWSQVDHPSFVDKECMSDQTLPRVCIYRHINKCRIITIKAPKDLEPQTIAELYRMCGGFFPEPVLLQREFSNPNYLPNQAPPSVDPAWKFQNAPPSLPAIKMQEAIEGIFPLTEK